METTTIEITDGQKTELDALKVAESESYKDVLQRLIEGYETADGMDEPTVRSIAQEEINDMVRYEALE